MTNKSIYFSHDSDAKDDPKMMLLIEELGLEGYGIFWILIEILRDQENYVYPLRMLPIVARRYNTTTAKIQVVINNYGLFCVNEHEFFYSESLLRRMELMEEKRQKLVNAGRKGGQKTKLLRLAQKSGSDATNNATNNAISNTTNNAQAKKRKEKKKKDITHSTNTHATTCYSFEEFWNDYGKKKDRNRAEKVYIKLSEKDREAIKKSLPHYIASTPDIQFRKHPSTYLNGRNWEDEIPEEGTQQQTEYKKRQWNTIED